MQQSKVNKKLQILGNISSCKEYIDIYNIAPIFDTDKKKKKYISFVTAEIQTNIELGKISNADQKWLLDSNRNGSIGKTEHSISKFSSGN